LARLSEQTSRKDSTTSGTTLLPPDSDAVC
jgi:hypothetical protein